MKRFSALCTAAGLTVAILSYQTATAISGHVAVRVEVDDSCQITGHDFTDFGVLNFGSIHGQEHNNKDAQSIGSSGATLQLECTTPVTYTASLDNGLYYDNGKRHMQLTPSSGATAQIPYVLYQDSNRTQEWGGSSGTQKTGSASNATPVDLTIFGRIPGSNDNHIGGFYEDTVTMNITW